MDDDITTVEPTGRRRRTWRFLRRHARRFPGLLALTAIVFAVVSSAAGSGRSDISDAQPIDYNEECFGEGCSREEVDELWRSFNEECFHEGCWMEEIAEGAGTDIYYDPSVQDWFYSDGFVVSSMLHAFTFDLGHAEAQFVRPNPGPTPGGAFALGATASCAEDDKDQDVAKDEDVDAADGATDSRYDCKP